MKVTLLDTQTGAVREMDERFDGYWWAEGNGSCDCNRGIFLGIDLDDDPGHQINTCHGAKRFLIIASECPDYTLPELNDHYPEELLRQNKLIP